jgi:hypothetical protein
VQECTLCHTQSPDTERYCVNCHADLHEYSSTAVALQQFRQNPRIYAVRIVVSPDSCPVCERVRGTYALDEVPALPVEGCTNPQGCNCKYVPMVGEIYP